MEFFKMLRDKRVPKTTQWLAKIFLIFLVIFTAFRLATVVFFKPDRIPFSDLLPSFWLGLKYDLRWIAILLFPISLLSSFKRLNPFYSVSTKKIWTYYLGFVTLIILFFYGADFGQFAYLNSRLNAEALVFMDDPQESLKMVWQSYPVLWILIALLGAILMMLWIFKRFHLGVEDQNINTHKFSFRRRWHIIYLLVLCWFMYGFLTARPLNFYRAFRFDNEFKSNLALNPLQNFATSLRFSKPSYVTSARAYYKTIAAHLQLDKQNSYGKYTRVVQPRNMALDVAPNVVIIFCKNLPMFKTSMSGNPANATPYMQSMANDGIFFPRCFSPAYGTARGLYALVTGIPDVQLKKFSSQNEETVEQESILNDITGYNKMYFFGGNAQLNNYEGLMKNVKGINITDIDDYAAKGNNVLGVEDKTMFAEANLKFRSQNKPFIALLQTINLRRPYALPVDNLAPAQAKYSDEFLKKYGFESALDYEAMAYEDESIKTFIEAAKKESYFANTIFVLVGDNGVEGDASAIYPAAWQEQRLAENHTPLLFYSPALLAPAIHTETVSQIDVLPTIAGFLNQPYTNATLGRDLFRPNRNTDAAFIIYHGMGWIGMVTDSFYYRKNLRIDKEELVQVQKDSTVLLPQKRQEKMRELSRLTSAMYETSKWMMLHGN